MLVVVCVMQTKEPSDFHPIGAGLVSQSSRNSEGKLLAGLFTPLTKIYEESSVSSFPTIFQANMLVFRGVCT